MLQLVKWHLFILFFTGVLTGCKKDASPVIVPSISNFELGNDNNKIAYPGHDLHLEAAVVAPGSIATIKLQITPVISGRGWSYSKVYTTGYEGLKNASFHEHLDVPEDALAGDYDLLLAITDQAGNKTESATVFKVMRDPLLPTITGLQLKLNETGSELNVAGLINAPGKIARLDIRVQSSAWTREFGFTDAEMVGKTNHSLNKVIDLSAAPKGHYHVHLKLTDQGGREVGYEYHFDKV